MKQPIIIKPTHQGLWYEDGVVTRVLSAGRYELPAPRGFFGARKPTVELVLVDVREKELTLKGQEILTSDKVAIRVSIIVQFKVVDPQAAMHAVESYEERLYSDVQLAARRSLASMTLEEILTNRNRLSDDILLDGKETAARYGVAILRADVKDIVFPGDLQQIMNRVLAAERLSQAQLVDARTAAQTQQIEAQAKAETQRLEAVTLAEGRKLQAHAEAEARRIQAQAEGEAAAQAEKLAATLASHPTLLRLRELEALKELARSANARIYIGFDKLGAPSSQER